MPYTYILEIPYIYVLFRTDTSLEPVIAYKTLREAKTKNGIREEDWEQQDEGTWVHGPVMIRKTYFSWV